MIKINFLKENNFYKTVNITGHANHRSNDEEYDIVCAGVSSITFGILNKLDKENIDGQLIVEDNLVIIETRSEEQTINIILDTLLVQLQTMSQAYPKHIKIYIKEKERNDV